MRPAAPVPGPRSWVCIGLRIPCVTLGSGHDSSVGAFVYEAGDDAYWFTTLAGGTSNCRGIGLFADADGSDTYQAASE